MHCDLDFFLLLGEVQRWRLKGVFFIRYLFEENLSLCVFLPFISHSPLIHTLFLKNIYVYIFSDYLPL